MVLCVVILYSQSQLYCYIVISFYQLYQLYQLYSYSMLCWSSCGRGHHPGHMKATKGRGGGLVGRKQRLQVNVNNLQCGESKRAK